MSKRIQIGDRRFILYPHPFLPRVFEAGIVTLTFRAEGISAFKIFTVPVNGKSQVIRKRDIFGTVTVFPAVIKIFVPSGTICTRVVLQRTAEFWACASAVRKFAVFPHDKSGITDGISPREQL